MVLGERIKRIRTFRGLTQRELGLKLGYEERNAVPHTPFDRHVERMV
jgi:transcriptional regulator with XRE-family HTH domain